MLAQLLNAMFALALLGFMLAMAMNRLTGPARKPATRRPSTEINFVRLASGPSATKTRPDASRPRVARTTPGPRTRSNSGADRPVGSSHPFRSSE